jgi:hypothetical protein
MLGRPLLEIAEEPRLRLSGRSEQIEESRLQAPVVVLLDRRLPAVWEMERERMCHQMFSSNPSPRTSRTVCSLSDHHALKALFLV